MDNNVYLCWFFNSIFEKETKKSEKLCKNQNFVTVFSYNKHSLILLPYLLAIQKEFVWVKRFKKMHDAVDDTMLIPEVFEDKNIEEWS